MNRNFMSNSGIILIDKKAGITTTKEEIQLKKIFNTRKVGHAGTLDPFATGLIICGVEKGTKVLSFLEEKNKTYLATLKLGEKTDTGDKDGSVIESKKTSKHTKEEIIEVFNSFLGQSYQIPPMYSAIKKDGVPLYKLARENKEVEREKRLIKVFSIELNSFEDDTVIFTVSVSKGTYIRTLGEDIASKLNELGHLTALRRTKVGQYSVEDAHKIDQVNPEKDLISIKDCFQGVKEHLMTDLEMVRVHNGADIQLPYSDQLVLLLNKENAAEALYIKSDKDYYKVLKEFI